MPSRSLLQRLFAYRRWADNELLACLEGLDAQAHGATRDASLHLVHHNHLVDRVFAAHLDGEPHGLASVSATGTLALHELRDRNDTCLAWYERYIDAVSPEALAETLSFVFTDGDTGCMSREEMLLHVLTHSSYHRGEAGRLLAAAGAELPWDTFAVFLHRSEPARRNLRAGAPAR
ncbi:DinB family protein [Variovorax paradoxus B4]|uniref:DinB family protein n=1 Tax=Variovorax paradoxus B4 TaxID=1246301 RepID=T1XB54_VARPD|nr:DinB family protein [Variovorax paradoxus]AGU49405.1 DinB family protein [Variovorax paradoxus B4]